MYIAIAYRWGDTNAHQYIVAGGANRADVVAAAERECNDRGGKYGVEVRFCNLGGAGKAVAYFPSLHKEKSPTRNWRLSTAEDIGLMVMNACETGKVLLLDASGARLAVRAVDLPEWLLVEAKRQIATGQACSHADGREW